jgi:hypothetical protein
MDQPSRRNSVDDHLLKPANLGARRNRYQPSSELADVLRSADRLDVDQRLGRQRLPRRSTDDRPAQADHVRSSSRCPAAHLVAVELQRDWAREDAAAHVIEIALTDRLLKG